MIKIYFIPGTMCDERLWEETWKILIATPSNYFDLVHIPIPQLSNINDITAFIENKLCKNSYVLGFSLGGYIASNIALNYPEKIDKLLLVSNMSSRLPEKETKERIRTVQWIKANGYTGISDKRINNLLHPNHYQNIKIKQLINAMDNTLGEKVLINQLTVTTQREHLLPQLFELPIPIKFLIGDSDNLVNLNKMQLAYNQSKATQPTHSTNKIIDVLAQTGHMLPLEQPEQLANTIKSWFIETDIIT